MATSTDTRRRVEEGERRFVIHDLGWDGYETLLELVGDHGVRVTYDRGNVELMSPLLPHERYKKRLARLVETITEELDIPLVAAGSTTFKSRALDRGLEPDECYYVAGAGRFREVERPDLSVDPPPDLAIEVEITQSVLKRLGIYAALGVPEVWRFDGKDLHVLVLGPGDAYDPSETSRSFPFLSLVEISRFILSDETTDDTRWTRGVRRWAREELLPRYRPEAGEHDRPGN